MAAVLPLPRLVFGFDRIGDLAGELALLGVRRPLLLSDRGLVKAGAAARVLQEMPPISSQYFDIPENPTTAGADAAYAVYCGDACDSIVALGGGSVLDTAKIVAAMAGCGVADATALLQNPGSINRHIVPLIAIPTTVGTGSESSPVAALHFNEHGMAIGTRSPFLVPRVAICDPSLTRSLPPRMIAATGFDALSHCLEGLFAEPEHPIIDALAQDGLTQAFKHLFAGTQSGGDAARAGLMAAAFAGGAAIHKGLGPAHAVAIVCGDQGLHHGALIAAALPLTMALLIPHAPAKATRAAAALGLASAAEIPAALRALTNQLGLPDSLRSAGYRPGDVGEMAQAMQQSHFNRTSPHAPSAMEYRAIVEQLFA